MLSPIFNPSLKVEQYSDTRFQLTNSVETPFSKATSFDDDNVVSREHLFAIRVCCCLLAVEEDLRALHTDATWDRGNTTV
jgi:hypothetical protein